MGDTESEVKCSVSCPETSAGILPGITGINSLNSVLCLLSSNSYSTSKAV